MDDVEALLPQQVGGLLGAVAAQNHQAVQLHLFIVVLHGGHLVHAVLVNDPDGLEGLAGGAQNGAPLGENAGEVRGLHELVFSEDQPLIAVLDAVNLHVFAKFLVKPLGHAPNRRVQPLAVAAAGEDSYSFHTAFLLINWFYTPLVKAG